MSTPWMQNLRLALPARPQIVLFGNIRDVHLVPADDGPPVPTTSIDCVWKVLEPLGYEFLVIYDPIDGLRVQPSVARDRAVEALKPTLNRGDIRLEGLLKLQELADYVRAVSRCGRPGALAIDYASRLVRSPSDLETEEHSFFTSCEKSGYGARQLSRRGQALFNPIIWLVNHERDLPSWFVVGNPKVHTVPVPLPDFGARQAAARDLSRRVSGFHEAADADRAMVLSSFADLTDGMGIDSLLAIFELARAEQYPFKDLAEAVRCYRAGVPDNPWRKAYVADRVSAAREEIGKRVLGQDRAISRTLDVLMRSVMGLTGAQASAQSNRPRGVLFFAGPSGVGKTELAKAITCVLFGSEDAYTRFDMSEFSAEHAQERLVGAPPGYIGHEAGGELTNAVRAKPFSVLLFDEIEKAHDRLMDKFLQILEDGRLTDGRGRTVYFSESVIVFTSNLGIISYGEDGHPQPIVRASDRLAPEEVEARVREAISYHFRYKMGRPELLNRIGDNIVVFNFIEPGVAEQIFDRALARVVRRVQEEMKLDLQFAPSARDRLLGWCTKDLEMGGRGIINRLEATLVNPLAREMFERMRGGQLRGASSALIEDVCEQNGAYVLRLRIQR